MRVLHRPLTVAALAVILVWLWMALTVHYNYQGNWTALFCIGDRMPAPPQLQEPLHRFPNSFGYDGQFYHDIAHDPLLNHGSEKYIDAPQLRQRRILVPVLAWLLALGRQQWIDTAYFAVMLGFLGLGVYWLARYALDVGRSAWWGLLYIAAPSTIVSIDRMTTDLAFVTLFLGFAYYLRSGPDALRKLWIIAALACLTRETGLCIAAGYAFYLLWQKQYIKHLVFLTSALPFVLWAAWVSRHTPRGGQSSFPFHFPFSAIIEAIAHPQSYRESPALQTFFTMLDVAALAAFLAALLLVCRIAWRDRALGSITIPFVALVLVVSSFSGMVDFAEVYSYGRVFGMLPLAVALDAIARRSRLPLSLFAIVTLRTMLLLVSPALGIVRGILR